MSAPPVPRLDEAAEHLLAERLARIAFREVPESGDAHGAALQTILAALPALSTDPAATAPAVLAEQLGERLAQLGEALEPYVRECRSTLAVDALHSDHAFDALFAYTRLIDALHRLAYDVALEEAPALLRIKADEMRRELTLRRETLPRRRERLEAVEADLRRPSPDPEDKAHRTYLEGVARDQRRELESAEHAMAEFEAGVPALEGFRADPAELSARIVVFARGGYGRAEMSFSSDVDTGYCIDTGGLEAGQDALFHELVLRMERVLQAAGLSTAHQFFELGEDLSRFGEPDALHTIPSILEGRALAGTGALLDALKAQFRAMLPFEALVRRKGEEFEAQALPELTTMDLKEDFGGLRSIQVPLWLLGVIFEAPSFMTGHLLALAREKGMLSSWEVARLLTALEFLYALRNFAGAAEAHHYDREARESGFNVPRFQPNRLDDHLARLYLFRSGRFESIDAFDSHRLRLVDEVQRVSRRLLARVLDRTLTQTVGPLEVSVHLGRKEIGSLRAVGDEGSAAADSAGLRARLSDSEALLGLFAYIAHTEYDLSAALKDALAGVVAGVTLPEDEAGLVRQAALLSGVMGGPFAHRALATLFEVSDPLAPGMPTLLGRFIPDLERAIFLLRRIEGQTLPLHTQIQRSLTYGAEELAALRRGYAELHALLQPADVLALNWSLLLQGLGWLQAGPRHAARTAERAAEVLASLGYRDPELEVRVRLLVEHHGTVAGLARTSTYMDQGLARYFEIAGRDVASATLLFLANVSVLRAQGEATEVDVIALRKLFHEANQMLGEMRGFPVQERSLELINVYFDRKKEDLIAETRLHLLLQQAIAQGVRPAVLEPLERSGLPASESVRRSAEQWESLQREIVLGDHSAREQARLEQRLLQALRNALGRDAVLALTAQEDERLSWFFAGFPNRYLMSALPAELAVELGKFGRYREAEVIADLVTGPQGAFEGLLIHTRGVERSHTRVAYALSRNRIDVSSGKVNAVSLGPDGMGFCYYFQIASIDPDLRLDSRELERMIAHDAPPELNLPKRAAPYQRVGVRVEFRGDDGKGYRIVTRDGRFEREPAPLKHLRVVLRDEPHLLYKVSRAFDLFEVEVEQSLITTIGNQVVDYFYLSPDDYDLLSASRFEEALINLVNSDLLEASG